MSSICDKCNLCSTSSKAFLHLSEAEDNHEQRKTTKPRILVVGPGPYDGAERFFDSPSGLAVREIASGIEEAEVFFHEAISCPSEKYGPREIKLCRQETFESTMTLYSPTVVIALGGNALYWATGEPIAVSSVRNQVVEEDGFFLLALPHLSTDLRFAPRSRRRDCEDLLEEYLHVFYKAEKICKYGAHKPPKNRARLIRTKEEAWKVLQNTQDRPVGVMDVETGQSMHNLLGGKRHLNKKALTHWHPGSKLLCTSWTLPFRARDRKTGERITAGDAGEFLFGNWNYETFVLVGEANCKEINQEFFQPTRYRRLKKDRLVVGHNIKFDNQVMKRFLDINPYELSKFLDTFYWFSLRDASQVGYGLKPLAKKYFGAEDWDSGIKEKLREIQKTLDAKSLAEGLGKLYADYRHLDEKELATYNAADTYWTARLFLEICCDPFYSPPSEYALRVAHNQAASLSRIEQNGLPVDEEVFKREAEKNHQKLLDAVDAFYNLKLVKKALVLCPISKKKDELGWLNSKLFQKTLVEISGVSVPTTATKLPSLRKDVVIKLGKVKFDKDTKELIERNEFETESEELWYRYHVISKIQHLSSNFFESYDKYIINGFIHPNFHICKSDKGTAGSSGAESGARGGGTKTGRLSTGDPQSQNLGGSLAIRNCFRVPKAERLRKRWRKKMHLLGWKEDMFRRLQGGEWLLVESDYNRIELVFLAVLSQDPKMMEIMAKGVDFHEATAREMFKIPEGEKVGKRERDIAKTLNFGLVYGQGVKAFAAGAGVSLDDAKRFFAQFHETFPGVKKLFDANEKKILEGEMVETLFGRRRSFRITGDSHYDAGQIREANNYIIQSAASDSTTEHLHLIYQEMDNRPILHNYIIPINTVHDSIWFLVRRDKYMQCCRFIKKMMEDTSIFEFEFGLPIEVEIKVGTNLANMKKVKV